MAVESVSLYPDGAVTCPCGEQFDMFWNGGELAERICKCGRRYHGEHRVTVMVVENPNLPEGGRCPDCGGELDEMFVGDERAGDEHFSNRACYKCGWHDVEACDECQAQVS